VARETKPYIPQAEDEELAKRLWEFTENLVQEKLEE
jgi:hypothetical protein